MLWLALTALVPRCFLLLRSGVSRDLSSLAELAVLSSKAEILSGSPPGLGRPDLEVISPPYCDMIGWSCSPLFKFGLVAYELLL